MPKLAVKAQFESQGFKYNREAVNQEASKCPHCGGLLRGANLRGYDPDKYVACCDCKTGYRTYRAA